MNSERLLLRSLAGSHALDCICALTFIGPLPVTTQALMDVLGAEISEKQVRRGLSRLLVLDLVIRCGGGNQHTWQLRNPNLGFQLPLPINQLERPVEAARPDINSVSPSRETESLPAALDPGNSVSLIRETQSGLESREITPVSLIRETGALKEGVNINKNLLFITFSLAEILPHLRESLAQRLLADDADFWPRGVLGHLAAYNAFRARQRLTVGAVVYPALKRLERPLAEYLPPAGLDFDAAVRWAQRGGQGDPEPSPVLEAVPAGAEPPPAGADLWERVVAQLKLELSAALFAQWLRPLTCESCADGCLTLRAPHLYVRDFVAARLLAQIERAAAQVSGQPVTVRLTLPEAPHA